MDRVGLEDLWRNSAMSIAACLTIRRCACVCLPAAPSAGFGFQRSDSGSEEAGVAMLLVT